MSEPSVKEEAKLEPTARCSRCDASAAEVSAFVRLTGPLSGRLVLCNACAAGSREDLRCSFCGKGEADVWKLVAGPATFICDRCVGVCADILKEERSTAPVSSWFERLWYRLKW